MARLLLVKLSAIGDVIHCLPAAHRLKQALPGLELHWLVEPLAAPLLVDNPCVDKVHVFEKKTWLGGLKSGQPATMLKSVAALRALVSELRSKQFDYAIDAQGLFKSAFLARQSGAKRVFGFKGTREMSEYLLSDKLDIGDYFGVSRHVVDLNLALADFVISTARGAAPPAQESSEQDSHTLVCFPLPSPPPQSEAKVASLFGMTAAPNTATKNIGFIAGTTWDTKIWPSDHWIELGKRLLEEAGLDCRIFLLGGPSDRTTNQYIYKGLASGTGGGGHVADITGETNLIDLVALFAKLDLVVGADTGPLHLACAVASALDSGATSSAEPGSRHKSTTKVLALHGSSPWGRNGPYGSPEQVAACHLDLSCQPCFSKKCSLGTIACMKDLPSEKVFQMVMTMLG